MGFNCGIVGLPNVGKSTLFNAMTAAGAEASNYPFCTIDRNLGIVAVPDPRLDALVARYRPLKTLPSTIEFVDIAGLVRGASKGEGLGNQFLAHIRDVDAIAHVVRCFDDPNVIHVDGSVNPQRDIEIVEAELIFKDLESVERRLAESLKGAKAGERKSRAEADLHARVREHLLAGRLVRYFAPASDEEQSILRELHLLTNKPVMYVCNVHETDLATENAYVGSVRHVASQEGARVVAVSAAVEAEVAELLQQADAADRSGLPAGMNLPDELARRETRLAAIAAAKDKIEARARARFAHEQAEHEAKLRARQARAGGDG
jgi:hypothetical protein